MYAKNESKLSSTILPFISVNRIFALSLNKISGTSAISTTTASTRFSSLHAPPPSTTVSPATPLWNPYASAADIPPFPNGSENRNRNGRQEVVSFQFRFGNHDEGTSLKFLILGLAMSISFRYHWSLPLRSPSI